ncbi:MAG: DUF6288 domain-containing protein [Phycisphaerales bacterium]|nr:DUF6288 domain-containing protein [Phycisphaerales bacterium]
MFTRLRAVPLIVLASFACALVHGAPVGPPSKIENPDFTQGGTIPEGATHDWNLGPTGARGWMYSNKLETSEARQVLITSVEAGSPADGVLQEGDVLLGVGGRPFQFDPRTEIGRAITEAEDLSGRLVLTRWRDGRRRRVTIELPVFGRYSRTAPFDCAKSKAILEAGCAALAERMKADPGKGSPIERCYNALALLASGNPDYLPVVRQQVEAFSTYTDPDRREYHSWWYGPINILMAEYVLVTGDRTFMPALERITMEIVRGQSPVGSWGHRFIQDSGRLAGYGMMNAPGLPLAISLVLARQAGVDNPELDQAIEKSARLIRFYVGKGCVPYGDHNPWIETHDDNGKNGAAAVLFNQLGDVEATEYFSRMSVASHGNERDNGHTGNYFNMLWAMPGVALSGPLASGAWMKEFGWYYDLARRWDGTFRHQGPPQVKPDSYRNWDASGTFLLAYAQSLGKTAMTGRTASIAPSVDYRTAQSLIDDGRDWGSRTRLAEWAHRSTSTLLQNLGSWSPVVRERAAMEIARRDEDVNRNLATMLRRDDLYEQIGACQAVTKLKKRAAPLVPGLLPLLEAEDLWLRIKAAEALAAIGEPAMNVVPVLLTMLAEEPDASDPRGMQQRYLCFALFDRRNGMLGRSLEGVDPAELRTAVVAGLRNEDARARGSFRSVYQNLSYESIEPLLPVIHEAVVAPAPSGIMFADEIRLAGLEVMAEHRIAEGIPLCTMMIDPDRWGLGNRINRCLGVLRTYGGAARSELPRLRGLEAELAEKRWNQEKIDALGIPELIQLIEADAEPIELRPLSSTSTAG